MLMVSRSWHSPAQWWDDKMLLGDVGPEDKGGSKADMTE